MPVHVDVTNTPVGDGSVLTVKVRPKSPLMFLATTVATVALVVGAQQLAGEWGLFALVGTFITLVLAYRNGNTCIVTVKAGALRVRYRPFWRPGVLLRARDLDQLWVEKRGDRRGHVWYDLVARSKRGGKLTLARELPDPASALHLEALVEDHLGILDVRQPRQVS